MGRFVPKDVLLQLQQEFYDEMLQEFKAMGVGWRYTEEQKGYAFKQIAIYGVRATSRILKMPRRTLQRWCRKYGISIKRCPDWVYEWAERRKKRRKFWSRKGYGSC